MKKKQAVKKASQEKKSSQHTTETLNRTYLFLAGLITFIALFPVLFNGFINFDDPQYIYQNEVIKEFSGKNLEAIFSQAFVGNYQPVTLFFYMLVHSLFGLSPVGYHLFSLLFHTANALLVFIIFFHLSGRNLTALLTALLFGIHPMHVESVAWVSALKDVLYTFFFLLALYYYWRYYIRSAVNQEKKYLFLSLLFFILSVLSKPQAVVLPIAFFLVDYLLKRKFTLKLILEKIPFIILSLAFGILAVVKQKESGAVQDYAYFEPGVRILFSCFGLMNYFYKILLPINLSIFYPYPETNDQINTNWVYAAPFILAIIGFFSWKFMKKSHVAAFGILFFLLTIILVLQLIPVGDAIIADRYTYLPATGLFFILAWQAESYINKKAARKETVQGIIIVMMLVLAAATFQRCLLWKDSISIYSDALKKEAVPILLNNRGVAYNEAGKDSLAVLDFRKVVSIKPRYPNGYKNLAFTLQKMNDHKGALEAFDNAIRYYPGDDLLYLGRAKASKSLGNMKEALPDVERLIRKNPNDADALSLRAEIYGQTGVYDKSLADLNAVIAQKPGVAETYANRGIVNSMMGNINQALSDYSQALKLNPELKNIYMNRSMLLKSQGRYQEALNDATTALNKGVGVNQSYLDELKSLLGK